MKTVQVLVILNVIKQVINIQIKTMFGEIQSLCIKLYKVWCESNRQADDLNRLSRTISFSLFFLNRKAFEKRITQQIKMDL